ncbi:IS110 family transposase [Klebsiella variicola]|uniref:Transposase, IS110 family n=1 Tax=Klebsiella variicola (strain 342) TaxID=507522 RepID=B5RKG9_KLEV3|nr:MULTISPECIES: IS110 family transposase [Klebsiella]HBQ5896642.1 IS110 family transposase [Klebsiella variicola subsp. variicola]HDG9794945.1 IS110 family transposase [Raoultella planticola]ACI12245.1 transposase, IS110 family [Klebsiella variicola]ACI12307.1 transposase, IS110 family [Klebsiella variicola]EKX4231792.1 IS110 family transposase [Klebsiella pneumoniae]
MTAKDQFAAYVGLDWADKKHDVCVQFKNGDRIFHVIEHTPEALDIWLNELHQRAKGRIAIAVELKKGPVVYALQKYPFVTVFPVHALSLARYRQAFWPSGAKDDPQDAELALDLMLRYPHKIKAIEADNPDIRLLQQLVEQRRLLVEDKRRFVNRLINTLKQYYPQPLEWFSHRDSSLFCELIIRWPSLQQLKRARSDTVRHFMNAKGGPAVAYTEQRVASIASAIPLATDKTVIEANALMATALASQIKLTGDLVRTYDERIESLFDTLPDAELFKSLPGMGPCMGPRMLAALGDNRNRFNSAEEIQNYAGIAPVTERSGQKSWVHWRWQCAKFVRQTFVEWTAKTVNSSYWARLYYQGQREKGKSHQSAIRALAFKWIRIIYRCWKTRTRYDEAKYLLALEARKSPLLKP